MLSCVHIKFESSKNTFIHIINIYFFYKLYIYTHTHIYFRIQKKKSKYIFSSFFHVCTINLNALKYIYFHEVFVKSPVLVTSSFFRRVNNKTHLAQHACVIWCWTERLIIDVFNVFPPQSLICCSYLSWSACLRRCSWAYWLSPLWRAASWADWLDSAPAYASRTSERDSRGK